MTRILTFLGILPPQPDVHAEYRDAKAAYDAACARKDTRGQHYALKRLQGANRAVFEAGQV